MDKYTTFEFSLISANDLKDVNHFTKMDVYAIVSITGDPNYEKIVKSPVSKNGNTNPSWNYFPMIFSLNESLLHENLLFLEIKLRCKRSLSCDKDISHISVPLKRLLDHDIDGKSFQLAKFQNNRETGKPKGDFVFSYRFDEKFGYRRKSSSQLDGWIKNSMVTGFIIPCAW
ncbi:hypothetical protein RIF29_27738 [Crotalaria pallida]|uniref:C2 domain-containing protein n=1 Tax=Crotalaria pallida TaxID=3830 RepID=A0AAN9HZ14_CROPI